MSRPGSVAESVLGQASVIEAGPGVEKAVGQGIVYKTEKEKERHQAVTKRPCKQLGAVGLHLSLPQKACHL